MHFGENTQVSVCPFLRNRGGCVGGTEQTTACYGVSTNSYPLVLISAFSPRRMAL